MTNVSLDDLFAQARAAMKAERAKEHARKAKVPVPEPVEPLGLFANPDNWVRTHGIALVHRESQLLLGNFWEWRHKSVADARRLVRSEEPIAVKGVEEVDFGLSALAPPAIRSGRVETQRIVTHDVMLEAPKVSAPAVLLCVHYYDGWTARAVLVEPVSFAEGGEILQLPAGVDVFSAMTRECKAGLRSHS